MENILEKGKKGTFDILRLSSLSAVSDGNSLMS